MGTATDGLVFRLKDRAKLATDNGDASVAELPADVRNAFIADHIDEQQQRPR